ncbi:MAG: glucokinase, family [Clostridia bacterium]|nr:glucokinase, family [Clostridia bacterium]
MYYIGIDLGGTNIAVGIVTAEGEIISKKSIKTGAERPFEAIMKDMAECTLSLLKEKNISLDDVKSIGIGTPGSVNTEKGNLVYANNFKYGINVPMRELLQKYINKPVYLGNDANVAALGEVVAGVAKGHKNAVMVTLGTGVGGGIIINGEIYEGQYSAGAEIGHIMLIHNGEQCTCGRKGCWEAYASATGLIKQTKAAMTAHPDSIMNKMSTIDNVSGRTAFDAARKGDAVAMEVVKEYIEYIAEGLVDMINIFRPEILIIGGGICNEGEYLLKPLREFINTHVYGGNLQPEQKLSIAKLGNDAGIIGAALIKM